MNFGLMGPGVIAEKFANACQSCEGVTLLGVASSKKERAQAFAEKHGLKKVYASYEGLLADPEIDAVYISVIHTGHFPLAKKCIQAGKAVLCEKPLTSSYKDTMELIRLASERKVLLMEAMWMVFLPSVQKALEWIRKGAAGTPEYMTCNFSNFCERDPKGRLFDPAQAGGGLLDVGVYCLDFLLEAAGKEPEKIQSLLRIGPTGVDEMGTVAFRFPGGLLAECAFGLRARLDNNGYIFCDNGKIVLRDFWQCRKAELYDKQGNLLESVEDDQQNGFVYEIRAFCQSFEKGEKECPQMPFHKTATAARIMDEILENGK